MEKLLKIQKDIIILIMKKLYRKKLFLILFLFLILILFLFLFFFVFFRKSLYFSKKYVSYRKVLKLRPKLNLSILASASTKS